MFLLLSYFGCSGVPDVSLVLFQIMRSCLGTWVHSGLGERCVLQGKGGDIESLGFGPPLVTPRLEILTEKLWETMS